MSCLGGPVAAQLTPLKAGQFTGGLLGVVYIDDSTQVAVGYDGAVLRSTDRGFTWSRVAVPTSAGLNQVTTVRRGGAVFAVGGGGTILRSADAGLTWSPVPSGTSVRLMSISFGTELNGVATGDSGVALATFDGGQTWQPGYSGVTRTLSDVSFAAGSTVVTAVGYYGVITRSADGGRTWAPAVSGTGEYLSGVYMTSPMTGVAVGLNGTVLMTVTGGASWNRVTSPTSDAYSEITFIDNARGWAVGGRGTVFATTDGGMSWRQLQAMGGFAFEGVAFADAQNGTAVGSGGTIMRTSDGGVSWVRQMGNPPATTASTPPPTTPATTGSLYLEMLGLSLSAPTGSVSWRATTATGSSGNRLDQLIGTGTTGENYYVNVNRLENQTCAQFIANLLTREGSRMVTSPTYMPTGGWFTVAIEQQSNSAFLCMPLGSGILVAGAVVTNISSNGISTVRPALFALGQAAQRRWGRGN